MTALVHRSVGATLAPAFPRRSRPTRTCRKRVVVEYELSHGGDAPRRRQFVQHGVDGNKAHVANLVDGCGEQNGWYRVPMYRRPRTAAAGCAAERPARRN